MAFLPSEALIPQDWQSVASYLLPQGMHFDHDVEVQQFASGLANLNYLISVDGKPAVFRRPPNSDAPPGAYDFSRQFKIHSRLSKHLTTVPRGIAYCDDHSVIGVPFLITEFRNGIAMKRDLPPAFESIDNVGEKLSRLTIDALVELHRLSPQEVGLDDLGNPDGFIERQIHGWRKRASRVMSEDQMQRVDQLRDWLVANQPPAQRTSIVHLDFKLDNVLIDPQSMTVHAIIDWELSTLGESCYDLIMVLLGWGEPNDIEVYDTLCAMPCDTPGWWTRRRALTEYCNQMGMEPSAEAIKFYWLLAIFRTFVAVAQLNVLHQKETMPNLEAFTEDMPGYIELALNHALYLMANPLDW